MAPRPGAYVAISAVAAAAVVLWCRRRRRTRALEYIEHDGCRMPLPVAHPEDLSLSAERLDQITRWSDGWVASGKVPGMITLIARHGKITYLHMSGLADVESKLPLAANTIMRFYSMTKPVTSVGAMILYERGLFQLDEPISHHLPAFSKPHVLEDGKRVPARREITFRDLLMHTAGLGYGDGETDIDELYENSRIGSNTPSDMTLAEFVDRLGRLPLAFHPGESWRYSYATDVLGRLLEVLTGLPLDKFLHDELFEPLGMVDSCFCISKTDGDRLARLAQVYKAREVLDIEVGQRARQLRRFERSNAYLLHRLRIGKAISDTSGTYEAASGADETSPTSSDMASFMRSASAEKRVKSRTRTVVISTASQPGWLDAPECPMSLSPLGGEPMLIQILRQLVLGGIERAVIITGFRGAQVRDALSSHPVSRQLELIFVDVGETYSEGFARSLLAAAPIVKRDEWLLHPTDHFYHHSLIIDMCHAPLDANDHGDQPADAAAEASTQASPGHASAFEAVVLMERAPKQRKHRAHVRVRFTEHAGERTASSRGSGYTVHSLDKWRDNDEDDDEDDAKGSEALGDDEGIEAGLFKCSAVVFEELERIASTLPHFSSLQIFQIIANRGRLGAMSTRGRRWFAIDGPETFEDGSVQSVRQNAGRSAAEKRAILCEEAADVDPVQRSKPRVVKSKLSVPGDIGADDNQLSATAPAKPRFDICPVDDAGDFTEEPVKFLSGGGGMLSTAHDYARFAQMLLNKGELDGKRILSRKTMEYMIRNQLPLEGPGSVRRVDIDAIATDSGFNETSFDGIGFGLGWSVVQDPIKASLLCSKGEYGWGGWASTFFAVDPEEDMFVMSLAQLAPSDRYPIRRQLRCLVNQTLI
mmetsp:Transcript_32726/g.86001  ORF Transcript_32726/g.86001 Transcript_32726/m.86001 type:complete len:875 (-) Transcript_32726:377-3001(-)